MRPEPAGCLPSHHVSRFFAIYIVIGLYKLRLGLVLVKAKKLKSFSIVKVKLEVK